jgi:hypothetical protein
MMSPSFLFLAVFFLFSSFAFGCMENWSIATAEVILFLGAGVTGLIRREFWSFPKRLNIFAVFVLALTVISAVQIIPLPLSFWKIADKDRITAYEEGLKSEELLQGEKYRIDPFRKLEAAVEEERYTPVLPGYLTLTRSPASTIKALIALFAGLCLILLIEDVSRLGEQALRKLALLVGFSGLVVGITAVVEKGMEKRTHILWLRESDRASLAFGPFVNGNHGEAFINLTFPLLCYLIWRKSKDAKKASDVWGMRIMAVAFVFLQGTLVFSGVSRGNLLAVALLPVAGLLHMGLHGKKKAALIAGTGLLAVLIFVGWFLVQDGLLTSTVRNQMNANVTRELSLLGKGLNTFEETFPSVVEKWYVTLPMKNEFLENEYLQIFYEGGIAPFVLSVLVCGFVLFEAGMLVFAKGARFWLAAPLIAESVRAAFDMSFHVFPLVGVFLLVFAVAVHRRR